MTPNESLFRRESSADLAQPWSAEEMLALLTRNVGATVAVVSRQQRVVYVNAEYARWFRKEPQELLGKTLFELYGEYNYARFMPFVERVLRGERVSYQRLLLNPDGMEEWRTICLTPWRNAHNEIDGFVTAALGVHELQVTMTALRVANQRLSSHMDNSPLAVLEMDHELRVVHCSRRAVHLMGWEDVVQIEARSLHELLGPGARDAHLADALHRLQMGKEAQNRAETSFVRASDGAEVHCEWFNSALTDASGRVTSIMSLVQDVSARTQIAREHHYLANHDSLTGLFNRSAFHQHFQKSLAHAKAHGSLLALMFIDLDGFKSINDAQGHQAGDEVLRIVAQRLQRMVRDHDTVARVGGDEFLILIDQDAEPDVPRAIGQRVIEALSKPMEMDGLTLQIGASIGIATHPPIEADAAELLRRADQAMYEAKRAGRGCLRYADCR